MKYRIFLTKLFLVVVILIIQLFKLGKFSKIFKCFNTKFIQVISDIKNCPELIWFSCVVQFRLKNHNLFFLQNLNAKVLNYKTNVYKNLRLLLLFVVMINYKYIVVIIFTRWRFFCL